MYSALNYFEAFYTCTYIYTIFSDDVYTILHLVYTIFSHDIYTIFSDNGLFYHIMICII